MQTQDEHIINKFREMISKRYEYDDLKKRFDMPDSVTPEIIENIKNYFLTTIYPPAVERKQLEEAFKNLGGYVRSPKKIWGLFGDMTRAIFKFGRHFMSALRAGIDSLNSFIGAKNFETNMAEIANRNGILPPMSDEEFEDTLYQLPREDIEKFIGDVRSLFKAMIDTELLKKTLGILDHVIQTMVHKPNVFPKEDVDGIRLGRSLLQRGYDLFLTMDESVKHAVVDIIYKNEMWFVNDVYKKKEAQLKG